MVARAVVIVRRVFKRYPMAANAVVYGSLITGAEFTQQTVTKKILHKSEKPAPYDFGSMARYGVLGMGLYPHVYFVWYRWLDGRYVGTAMKTVVKKLLLDQFVLTPPLLCTFYILMSTMERKDDIFEECRKKFVPTFRTSCLFWLPAQTLNFLLVPPIARVVYVGSCAFVWINILVWIKRQNY